MKDALGRVQRALVFGAASEIANATLRELLRQGPLDVILAARAPELLETSELERLGASVDCVEFDARAFDAHADAIESVFDRHGDVDLVLVAFGILGNSERVEGDPVAAVDVAETNYVGAVSVLTLVAERLRRQGHGTVVVLSSVAAQRARRSNYVYGSTKAGLDAFAQGLRLKLEGSGVEVLIVRPGFVHTRMTAGLAPPPLSVGPEAVASAIVDALPRGGGIVWVPPVLRAAMWIVQLLPRRLMQRL
jgi:decaprenylphospho-beta-D-erythro-pentofuranosid-2-ulose 2-reductase